MHKKYILLVYDRYVGNYCTAGTVLNLKY